MDITPYMALYSSLYGHIILEALFKRFRVKFLLGDVGSCRAGVVKRY